MRFVAEAVGNLLARILGESRVFHGFAEDADIATLEFYATFMLTGTGDITPSTVTRGEDAIINQNVQISFFGLNDSKLMEVMYQVYDGMMRVDSMRCGDWIRAYLVSQSMTVDPDKTEDGRNVFAGVHQYNVMYSPATPTVSSSSSSSSSASSSSPSSASSSSSS